MFEDEAKPILPSYAEFQSLLLDKRRPLRKQPEAERKALDFLWSITQLAPHQGPMDISMPSTELLDLGLIPQEVAERIKEGDTNTLQILVDPTNKNIFKLIEEYTKRKTCKIIFEERSLPARFLTDLKIKDTFKLEKTEDGRSLSLISSCSPQRHIHILSEKKQLLSKDIRTICNVPLVDNEMVFLPNKTIAAADINRLLTICYCGLGGHVISLD